MTRTPPRYTVTDTFFTSRKLFRSREGEGPGHGARRSGQDHPDAGIPARRRGRLLRLARPARQGPGHLLRDLADPRRLDRRAGNLVPARIQLAHDRPAADPRGDAGPLPGRRDRQRVGSGKSVPARVDPRGRRTITKTNTHPETQPT